MAAKWCSVSGCFRHAEKVGMCGAHYQRNRKYGDVNILKKDVHSSRKFMKEVVLGYEDKASCLTWPYARNPQGYAIFSGRVASRVVCEKVNGLPPSKRHEAAHSCGNGSLGCVNPNHVSWKTRTENEREKVIHGTSNRGERSAHAKLTNEQAIRIKAMVGKFPDTSIGRWFGVSATTIREIRIGKRWAWLKGEAA